MERTAIFDPDTGKYHFIPKKTRSNLDSREILFSKEEVLELAKKVSGRKQSAKNSMFVVVTLVLCTLTISQIHSARQLLNEKNVLEKEILQLEEKIDTLTVEKEALIASNFTANTMLSQCKETSVKK